MRHANLTALYVLIAACVTLEGCAREVPPAQQARSFWAAVNEGDTASALALSVPGDPERQTRQLRRLRSAGAQVTDMPAIPAEAQAVLLQTQLLRHGPDGDYRLDTVTVLRRSGDDWRVDLDATAAGVRDVATAAMIARLKTAAERLRAAAGDSAEVMQQELRGLLGELRTEIDQRTDRMAEELAAELADSVQKVGEELITTLQTLERELQDDQAEDEPADAPSP